MIKSFKNKYYQYNPKDFMPIYIDGKLSNKNEFHIYKLKQATTPVISRLLHTI